MHPSTRPNHLKRALPICCKVWASSDLYTIAHPSFSYVCFTKRSTDQLITINNSTNSSKGNKNRSFIMFITSWKDSTSISQKHNKESMLYALTHKYYTTIQMGHSRSRDRADVVEAWMKKWCTTFRIFMHGRGGDGNLACLIRIGLLLAIPKSWKGYISNTLYYQFPPISQ
jgi:hypothetical protein